MNHYYKIFTLSAAMAGILTFSNPCSSQIMVRVAGTGFCGFSGDGGSALNAEICMPWGLAVDNSGNTYIGNWSENVVRKVSAAGIISTWAGNGSMSFSGDGGKADTAGLPAPWYLYFDNNQNLFVNDGQITYRKITPEGIITTVAGSDTAMNYQDGVLATSVFLGATSMVADHAGNLYFAVGSFYAPPPGDTAHYFIRKVTTDGIINTYAGNGSSTASGIPAVNAHIANPIGMVIDGSDNIYFSTGFAINKIDKNGIISLYAGNGTDSSDGATTSNAAIFPTAMAFSPAGELYFSEGYNSRIRKISTDGIVTTVVGTGVSGYSGDSVIARNSRIFTANDLAFDQKGNLYFDEEDGTEHFAMVFKVILEPAAVPQISKAGNYVISPNPSAGIFNLTSSQTIADIKITISNCLGQTVYQNCAGTNTIIDLSAQPAGIYCARISDEKGSILETQKLVKQ